MFKKKDDINYEDLNLVLKYGKNTLKITYALIIFGIILITSIILKKLGIGSILMSVLKILTPFILGTLIAWFLAPLVTKLETKFKMKRFMASILVFALFLAVVSLIFSIILPTTYNQLSDFVKHAPDMFASFKAWLDEKLIFVAKKFKINPVTFSDNVYQRGTEALNTYKVNLPRKITGFVTSVFSGGVSLLFSFIIGFYMLIDFDKMQKGIVKYVPLFQGEAFRKGAARVEATLRTYFKNLLFVMVILGTFQTLSFYLSGLSAPLVFGLLCAFTNIIPYIGPYIGGVPAVVVGFTISPQVGTFTLISVVLCQLVESNFLTPVIMSKKMELHPVVIMLSLAICGYFFGFVGMLISTPLISCLKVIFEELDKHYHFFKREEV